VSGHNSLLGELIVALDGAPAARLVDVSTLVLRKRLPIRGLWMYVVDYSEDQLRLVPTDVGPQPASKELSVRGTVAGRAYLTRDLLQAEGDDGLVLWAPVFRRSEAVGVLGLPLERDDDEVRNLAAAVAMVVGSAILGAKRHSDVFELARGAEHLRLAAAMQWDLLPLPTYKDTMVEVAGRVEPAYDIGGDAFDFAANDDVMEIGVFDAMGHGLRATLLTTLAVGAYRYGRRRLGQLVGVAGDIDEAVENHVEGEAFVTGHLCRLDPSSGVMEWVNCGHPVPMLIRDHTGSPIDGARPALPFGLGLDVGDPARVSLQPNDIVLFYSDGLIEARPDGGPEFGMDHFVDLAGRHGDPSIGLLTMVRTILNEVVDHTRGILRDDATLVAVRWTGGDGSPGGLSAGD
jgi:serine phosphatase RsbU (regulator of sigma subunit)